MSLDGRAVDPMALDLRKISNFCDYFVVMTGTSVTHLNSLSDNIKTGMKKAGVSAHHQEGSDDAHWQILDYNNVIVHIFDEQSREFYDLEHLWADAKKVNLKKPAAKKSAV